LERLVHAVKKVANTEEQKERLFELIIKKGIFSVKELATLSRTLHLRAIYRFNSANKLELPTKIRSYKGTTTEPVLVDSGAMENFIDHNLVKRLRLGTQPLERPIKLRNIDGTFNTTGEMKHYIDLMMCRADKKVKECFYVTGHSGIELILGYPWLQDFNPHVDWPTNTIPGPPVEIKTLLQDKIAQYTRSRPTTPQKVDPVNLVIQATITEPTPTFPEKLVQATKKAVAGMTKEQIHALIFEAATPQVHLNWAVPKKQDPPPTTPMEQQQVEDLSTTTAPEEKTTEEQVPERYHNFLDIFAKPVAGQLPPHHKWDLKVRLIPNAPSSISCTPYPLFRAEQVFQDKYIKENLARGFIRESNSPYSTPFFYNKKKDGTFWPLFDYRKINAITIKDVSPLPWITIILKDTVGVILFSKFDLREGYYNVAVEEESQDILAFKTTDGLYAPRVMPFGPTNCPAIMQKFMNHVFRPLYDRYGPRFKNYMDNCGIFMRVGKLDLYRQITQDFFQVLRENSLFLKPSKCLFEVTEIDFLGLHLMQGGITIAPDKLSAIQDWPRNPRNLKELQKVLGVLGYQRPFIPNFATIMRPLTALLKKDNPFTWTPECVKALDTLIEVVTSSPVLVAPN
jgi:hypothetical protein